VGNYLGVATMSRHNKFKNSITTEKGRVVYDRKPHFFSMKDGIRVLLAAVENLLIKNTLREVLDGLIDAIVYVLRKIATTFKSPLPSATADLLEGAWRFIRLGVQVKFTPEENPTPGAGTSV
jgi:hypothetical protein